MPVSEKQTQIVFGQQMGSGKNYLLCDFLPATQKWPRELSSSRNRPFSALIGNLGNPPYLALESFGNRPRFPVIFPFHQSPDCAPNHETRRLSMPDREFSPGKGEGVLHRAPVTHEWFLRGFRDEDQFRSLQRKTKRKNNDRKPKAKPSQSPLKKRAHNENCRYRFTILTSHTKGESISLASIAEKRMIPA